MVVGEYSRDVDLNVNICREKKLTNIRAAGRDENIIITPHREMGLEEGIEWIADEELVEVTPQSVRLRKKFCGKPTGRDGGKKSWRIDDYLFSTVGGGLSQRSFLMNITSSPAEGARTSTAGRVPALNSFISASCPAARSFSAS